jgi:hypothetical protein
MFCQYFTYNQKSVQTAEHQSEAQIEVMKHSTHIDGTLFMRAKNNFRLSLPAGEDILQEIANTHFSLIQR